MRLGAKVTERAIVIVDVAGSTPLFIREGDERAMQRVTACLERIGGILSTFGGEFVVSRGDDVHFLFDDPGAAFAAAEVVLADPRCRALDLHYSMHWGEALDGPGNIFGDAVNLAARLAAASNPGEVLLSQSFAELLPEGERQKLRVMRGMTVKGLDAPIDAFALSAEPVSAGGRTTTPEARMRGRTRVPCRVLVSAGSERIEAGEGTVITIGRAEGCTIRQEADWVSRLHATLRVRSGRVELTDKSSNGLWLATGRSAEILIRRETVVLVGSGMLSAGIPLASSGAQPIRFSISHGARETEPPDLAGRDPARA